MRASGRAGGRSREREGIHEAILSAALRRARARARIFNERLGRLVNSKYRTNRERTTGRAFIARSVSPGVYIGNPRARFAAAARGTRFVQRPDSSRAFQGPKPSPRRAERLPSRGIAASSPPRAAEKRYLQNRAAGTNRAVLRVVVTGSLSISFS